MYQHITLGIESLLVVSTIRICCTINLCIFAEWIPVTPHFRTSHQSTTTMRNVMHDAWCVHILSSVGYLPFFLINTDLLHFGTNWIVLLMVEVHIHLISISINSISSTLLLFFLYSNCRICLEFSNLWVVYQSTIFIHDMRIVHFKFMHSLVCKGVW